MQIVGWLWVDLPQPQLGIEGHRDYTIQLKALEYFSGSFPKIAKFGMIGIGSKGSWAQPSEKTLPGFFHWIWESLMKKIIVTEVELRRFVIGVGILTEVEAVLCPEQTSNGQF